MKEAHGRALTVRLGKRVAPTYASLVKLFPAAAFASPRRSTVPLLDYWREPQQRLGEFAAAIGLDLGLPAELSFEFPVRPPKGRGKPSFTDLMISTQDAAVAIEAKFTEPPYQDVRSWLRDPVEVNRSDVLRGWLQLINGAVGCSLQQDSVMALPYQLIHRTASACSVERPTRAVVYLGFGTDSPACYAGDLAALRRLIGDGNGIRLHAVACAVEKLPNFDALEARWQRRDPETADAVRAALISAPLFVFHELRSRAL